MKKKIFNHFLTIIKFSVKNAIRTLFFASLVLIVLFCIGWFTLVKYFNAHNLGYTIANSLEESLGYPVIIKEVKLASLNKVQIIGLKVIDNSTERYGEFLSAEELYLRYELLPLLNNRVEIKEIVLNDPVIHIVKDKDGNYNTQNLTLLTQKSEQGQEFKVQSLSGRKWEVVIEDWIIKNGTFAYMDIQTRTSHSLRGFNAHFIDLKFNELSDFTSDFTFKNRIKKKSVEAEISLTGKINLADFRFQDMSVSDAQGEIKMFKKPITFNFNINDFTAPKLEAAFNIPAFTYEDISSFYTKSFKEKIPAFDVDLQADFSDNFTNLNVASLQIKNKNLTLQAQGNFDLSSKKGQATYKTKEFEISKLTFLTFLEPYQLSGKLSVQGKVLYDQNKLTWPSLKADLNKINAFISNFNIEEAKGTFEAKNNFNYMSAQVKDGIFKVGRQIISEIKGNTWLEYKKQNFFAQIQDTMLNDKKIKMSVSISDVANAQTRRIQTLIYTSIFDPLEIFDLTEDFVTALSEGPRETIKEEGSLDWLHNFKNNIPKFMPNFRGSIYADEIKTPIVYGKDFYAEFDLENLLPGMNTLNGKMETSLKEGIIYKLEEAAERQKALGIAFQPFVIMSNMEKAGSFKMKKVLKDTPVEIMNVSVNFTNGKMDINNFYLDGNVIAATIGGWVDWHLENLDLDIYTMFKNTSKRGALSENLTDESGDPALAFRTHKTMKDPAVQMKSPKKTGKKIQEARQKGLDTDFKQIKDFIGVLNNEKTEN